MRRDSSNGSLGMELKRCQRLTFFSFLPGLRHGSLPMFMS